MEARSGYRKWMLVVMGLLLTAGCASTQTPPTPGMYKRFSGAVWGGDTQTVKQLLEKGVDVDVRASGMGYTPLMAAALKGYTDMVGALLAKGADVNAKSNGLISGITALMNASSAGHADIVEVLLPHGANVNAKSSGGVTALMLSASKGHTEIVRALLATGADVNTKDKRGRTALSKAASNEHTDIVQFLKKAGAKIEQAEKPEWKIGYWWEYAWKRPDRSGTYTQEVIREDIFEGVPCYVFKRGRQEYYITKDVLGYIARTSKGRVDRKRTPPLQVLSWPLEVGKKWENRYIFERPMEEKSVIVDRRLVVAKVEEVKVPAGTFKAFKIERYTSYSGELFSEYWYSPKVKGFVKIRIYRQDGIRETKLINYKVD